MTTGPKTPEGKAVVALNGVRHGLRTQALIIPGVESQEDWDELREAIIDTLAPADPLEESLAHRIAEFLWRLRRITRAEQQAIASQYKIRDRKVEFRKEVFPTLDKFLYRNFFNPEFVSDPSPMPSDKELDALIRYEAHLNRQLYQALHELEARRDRREGHPSPLARVQLHGMPGSP